MAVRTFDDVVQIIKPDVDSQYRLRPCKCGSAEVVYAQYITPAGAKLWRGSPYRPPATADPQTNVRHDAQLAWNRRNNRG